jgi:hypothetical protein
MKPFLLALREQVVPSALIPFLYDIKPPVSFVDGCLVVEVQDFRRIPDVRNRVVMRPAPEALSQTVEYMLERRGEGGDEQLSLELESRIIVSFAFIVGHAGWYILVLAAHSGLHIALGITFLMVSHGTNTAGFSLKSCTIPHVHVGTA